MITKASFKVYKLRGSSTAITKLSSGTLISGFDIELANHIRNNVSIPVIASSGAGKVEQFSEVLEKTKAEAALAAGIFHREEVPIEAVRDHMLDKGIETR